MQILGALRKNKQKPVDRGSEILRRLSSKDYNRYLELCLDGEVFYEPEEILKLYRYNHNFIHQYGPERIDNARIVMDTIGSYRVLFKNLRKSQRERISKEIFDNNFYKADKVKYQNLLLGFGENDWMAEFIKGSKLVTASYDNNRYECLIINKVIETFDKTLLLQIHDAGCGAEILDLGDVKLPMVIFPISSIIPKGSTNHARVRSALKTLTEESMGISDNEDYEYHPCLFFTYSRYYKKKGKVCIVLSREFWNAYADLKKYISIDSDIYLSLRSGTAMRMYELLLLNHKFTISVKKLCQMFKLTEHYPNKSDFVRKVIEPAKKELTNSKAPFSFKYKVIRGEKYNSIEAITFTIDCKSIYKSMSIWAIEAAEKLRSILN